MSTIKELPTICAAYLMLTTLPMNANQTELLEPLQKEVASAITAAGNLSEARRTLLGGAAKAVARAISENGVARLTFICTHNSRRSHLSQIWAQTAAYSYGISGVQTFSGGTETTACNPRTVASLRRLGFSVVCMGEGDNPRYLVQYAREVPPLEAYSKIYDQAPNPTGGFIAMMCCSHADENCPLVRGSQARIALHYEDPKQADGTAEESHTYDTRSREIAAEMFYLMGHVVSLMKK